MGWERFVLLVNIRVPHAWTIMYRLVCLVPMEQCTLLQTIDALFAMDAIRAIILLTLALLVISDNCYRVEVAASHARRTVRAVQGQINAHNAFMDLL